MRFVALFLGVLSVWGCGGCATILRGSHETMTFRTVPAGATVTVDGQCCKVSAVDVVLRRKAPHEALISMKGYRTIRFLIEPEWDGVSLVGNIILPGGSLGLVADRMSGADMNFCPLAPIKLIPTTNPSDPEVALNDFKGHLLSDTEVLLAVDADRHDRAQFFRGEP